MRKIIVGAAIALIGLALLLVLLGDPTLLIVRTAIPLGYLALAVALLLGASVGLWWIVSGIRAHRVGRSVLGVMITAAAAAAFLVNLFADEGRDFNPYIESDSQLEGVWTGPHAALDLRHDRSYQCRGSGCDDVGRSGRWERLGDFELGLSPGTSATARSFSQVCMRMTSLRGRLQLTRCAADLDMWDGRIAFERISPVRL